MLSKKELNFLINLANTLDRDGEFKTADLVDTILSKTASGEGKRTMNFKVHPLQAAVALGLLDPSTLGALHEEQGVPEEPEIKEVPMDLESEISALLDSLKDEIK